MRLLSFFLALCFAAGLLAQPASPDNWWELDRTDDTFPGVSAAKAHQYLTGKEAQEVIVAVLDSGVDIEHEDLRDIIWTNPGEIPGNGIDDDRNGYVDDIHGWNFIGGADGRNIDVENLEVVRMYNQLHRKYNNRNRDGLSKREREEYDAYVRYKTEIDEKRAELEPNVQQYAMILDAFQKVVKRIGKEPADITADDIANLRQKDQATGIVKQVAANSIARGESFGELYGQLEDINKYYSQQYQYNYNVEFDARDIVGDNPDNLDERYYGNSDVTGPDASHGTHVAGIIAAVRDNNFGVNGVGGPSVRIMAVRTVPNGDERDKDVANAIRYAVDNGASIINMSFGKGISPHKGEVDAAMKYAEKNDVLLVHAAGNDGKELTLENNFPNDTYQGKRKTSKVWIEVGAASANYDENLAANFSNYNKKTVDVFAPGESIFSTIPGHGYKRLNGTSFAAPMVAGIAALLRSYFPDLKAKQIREIILESALPVNLQVNRPGSEEERVSFSELSATGGLANAYTAVKLAERTKGKKKHTSERDPSLLAF